MTLCDIRNLTSKPLNKSQVMIALADSKNNTASVLFPCHQGDTPLLVATTGIIEITPAVKFCQIVQNLTVVWQNHKCIATKILVFGQNSYNITWRLDYFRETTCKSSVGAWCSLDLELPTINAIDFLKNEAIMRHLNKTALSFKLANGTFANDYVDLPLNLLNQTLTNTSASQFCVVVKFECKSDSLRDANCACNRGNIFGNSSAVNYNDTINLGRLQNCDTWAKSTIASGKIACADDFSLLS